MEIINEPDIFEGAAGESLYQYFSLLRQREDKI